MAEILSLINEYYEISKIHPSDEESVRALNQNAFPHYSESVVNAFKMVLATIIKSKTKETAESAS